MKLTLPEQSFAGFCTFKEERYRVSQKSIAKTLLIILILVKMESPNL